MFSHLINQHLNCYLFLHGIMTAGETEGSSSLIQETGRPIYKTQRAIITELHKQKNNCHFTFHHACQLPRVLEICASGNGSRFLKTDQDYAERPNPFFGSLQWISIKDSYFLLWQQLKK